MDKNKINKELNELAEFIKKTVLDRVQKYGKNRKGVNTLVDSDLIKNMKVTDGDYYVELSIAEYWMYVSTGWKFNNYQSGKVGLLNALKRWAIKKHIADNDKEAMDIAERLHYLMIKEHRPIPARPFMVFTPEGYLDVMIPELNDYLEGWFDRVFEAIINDIDNYFNL